MSQKNKLSKGKLVLILTPLILVAFMQISAGFFLEFIDEDSNNALPHTTILYYYHYPDEPIVKESLLKAYGISGAITLLFLALLFIKKPKPLYGDARFANKSEIKEAGLLGEKGIILGRWKGKYLVFDGQQFVLIRAPTRSGKGVSVVIPNLLNWYSSALVLDLKLENWNITSEFRRKCGQKVYLFNPLSESRETHRWNPLSYLSDDPYVRIDDIQRLANYICPTPLKADPMWTTAARDLFFGVCSMVLELEELPNTMGEVARQLKTEQETAEYLSKVLEERKDELSPGCIRSLSNFINKAEKERSGVKSTLTAALQLFENPLIDAATSEDDFDLRKIRKEKISIYLGVPGKQLARLAPLLNLFIQQLVDVNLDELPARYDNNGKLIDGNPEIKESVLMLLDEFTAIGRMEALEKGVSFIAGYNLRLMPIIQSMAQLKETYGDNTAVIFDENHACKVVFAPKNPDDANKLSDELGYQTVKQKSVSTPRGMDGNSGSQNVSDAKRALMLPQELKLMGKEKLLVLLENTRPIMGEKIFYYQEETFTSRISKPQKVQKIEPIEFEVRGEIEPDLELCFNTVPIPKKSKDEPLSDEEIDAAANAFWANLN